MSLEFAIQTDSLTKSYSRLDAVQSLNLAVPRDGITAFLGRNGAGKSSTIKMLLGLIPPSSGGGTILGNSITNHQANRIARKRIAYVAENKPLYGYMTVAQIIRFTASFYEDWQSDAADKLLKQYELPAHKKVKSLSKGMRTKLALLLAMARRPELLILDEPSEGLDPVGIERLLEEMVAKSAEGTAVFFSSHQIAEVERIADRVCILDKGRLMVDASLDDLRVSYRRIDLVFSSPRAADDFQISGVESVQPTPHGVTIFASSNAEAVVERARDLNADVIEVGAVGLREIFLETVKEA
jgi:ABC-2 type transport system ATP-binding protein